MDKLPLVIQPGIGSEKLHLGQTEKEVREFLGKPSLRIWKFKDSFFYRYKKKGIDLDFGNRGGKLKIIFFYLEGHNKRSGANVITDKGLKPGDARSQVLEAYGEPDKKGGPNINSLGRYFNEWFYYRNGIQFEFNNKQKICIISISKPE